MPSERRLASQRANALKAAEVNRKPQVTLNCLNCAKEFQVQPCYADDRYSYTGRRKFCSNPCRYAYKRGPNGANAGNHAAIAGSRNPNWKGGIASERKERYQQDLRVGVWRRAVYYRDNYTCQRCKKPEYGKLRAHHIATWAEHPALRFEVSNGITLCISCHKWVHSSENTERLFLL